MKSKTSKTAAVMRTSGNNNNNNNNNNSNSSNSNSSKGKGFSCKSKGKEVYTTPVNSPITSAASPLSPSTAIPIAANTNNNNNNNNNNIKPDDISITPVISKEVGRKTVREAPDGEGLFLQQHTEVGMHVNIGNKTNPTLEESYSNEPELNEHTARKSRKGSKGSKKGKPGIILTSENVEAMKKKTPASRPSVKKGKLKQQAKTPRKKSFIVDDTTANNIKAKCVATDKGDKESKHILSERKEQQKQQQQQQQQRNQEENEKEEKEKEETQQEQQLNHLMESKTAPTHMHIISHSIASMQKFGTLRSVTRVSTTSPPHACSYSSPSSSSSNLYSCSCSTSLSPNATLNCPLHLHDKRRTRNTSGGDGNGDDVTHGNVNNTAMHVQEPPEKPQQRYLVEPPPTIPREIRKETTRSTSSTSISIAATATATTNTTTTTLASARAPSAPPLSPSLRSSSSSDVNNTSPGLRTTTHTSLEDALDGLRTTDILFPTRQLLTRSLASPAEKERTATIVFDLDETLCNNRCHGPAILRPGAVEMLRRLRSLYPHPQLHPRDTPVQSSVVGKYGKTAAGSNSNSNNSGNSHNNQQGKTTTTTRGRGGGGGIAGVGVGAASTSTTTTTTGGGGGGALYSASSSSSVISDGVTLRLELIIWTASVEVVARPVIARLDPDGTILDDVIYRDVRWYREGGYTKDLRRIGRHLDRNIIVENAPSSVSLNRRNAILVNDFVNNNTDRQLIIVQAILQEWLENVNALVVYRHLQQLEQKRHRVQQDGGETPEPDQLLLLAPSSVVTQARSGSTHSSSVSRSRGDISRTSSSFFSAGITLQELELRASAIHFLTQHPFLSPGTRYVRPSAWKQALKCISETNVPNTNNTNTTNAITTNAAGCNINNTINNNNNNNNNTIITITAAAVAATSPRKSPAAAAIITSTSTSTEGVIGIGVGVGKHSNPTSTTITTSTNITIGTIGGIGCGRNVLSATTATPSRPAVIARPRGHRLFANMGRAPREVR